MLRKSIHFQPQYWTLLQAYMRANGVATPSLAIEHLLKSTEGNIQGEP